MKVDGRRWSWGKVAAAFSVGGLVSASSLGAALGQIGAWLSLARIAPVALLVIVIPFIMRDLDLMHFPVPQTHRQTNGSWAKRLPAWLAATLWGLDLGLVFTTWRQFSGVLVLPLAALLLGDPAIGAALFGGYWIGRAAPVLAAPMLLANPTSAPSLMDSVVERVGLFRRLDIIALSCTAILLTVDWAAKA